MTRATSLVALVGAWLVTQMSLTSGQSTEDGTDSNSTCFPVKDDWALPTGSALDPPGLSVLVFLGMGYTFWALGYVVEMVLLPALETGISKRLALPASLTSASLLSLGGCSVPLLFINVITMARDPVSATGIGMALGGAAFNLLCVLPFCYFSTNWSQTPLYWWPLIRDLGFYVVGLAVVLLFFHSYRSDWASNENQRKDRCWEGVESRCCYQALFPEGNITGLAPVEMGVLIWWEGLVVLGLYLMYLVVLRWNNKFKWAVDKFWTSFCCSGMLHEREETRLEIAQFEQRQHEKNLDSAVKKLEKDMPTALKRTKSAGSLSALAPQEKKRHILQVVGNSDIESSPAVHRAITLMYFRFKNAEQAFATLQGGISEKLTLRTLQNFVGMYSSEILRGSDSKEVAKIEEVGTSLYDSMMAVANSSLGDSSQSSKRIAKKHFIEWFLITESRVVREMNRAFDIVDETNSGRASAERLSAMLEFLGVGPSKRTVRKTREKLEIDAKSTITRSQFDEWYRSAMAWVEPSEKLLMRHWMPIDNSGNVEDQEQGGVGYVKQNLWGKRKDGVPSMMLIDTSGQSICSMFFHVIGAPIRLVIILSTQAWTGPASELSFVLALIWVLLGLGWLLVLSWILLYFSDSISETLGIPKATMGSTFLAIGANFPHFLSSIMRATQATEESQRSYSIVRSLEHAIKGNVFDLLFGLPLAWMIASSIKGRAVYVGASNIFSSLWMLMLIVTLLLILWFTSRWNLNILVCSTMLLLYVLFIIQDVLLADWLKPVPCYVHCSGCMVEEFCANA